VMLKQLLAFKNLGSEYLNVVFGWKPFVSDLRKIYYLTQSIDKEIGQLIRNNAKLIRRRANVSDVDSTSQTVTNYAFPFANVYGAPPGWPVGYSVYKVTTRTQSKQWWSGAYQYYLPQDVSLGSAWDRRARLALFGGLPTPALLWEVLPWSWLTDWFFNVGDVLSNMSANAVTGLTTRWSFIMEHQRTTTTQSCETWWLGRFTSNQQWAGGSHTFSSTTKVETKARRGGGNPFGLGVTLGSLSGYQLGILAALGLSRSSVR